MLSIMKLILLVHALAVAAVPWFGRRQFALENAAARIEGLAVAVLSGFNISRTGIRPAEVSQLRITSTLDFFIEYNIDLEMLGLFCESAIAKIKVVKR